MRLDHMAAQWISTAGMSMLSAGGSAGKALWHAVCLSDRSDSRIAEFRRKPALSGGNLPGFRAFNAQRVRTPRCCDFSVDPLALVSSQLLVRLTL